MELLRETVFEVVALGSKVKGWRLTEGLIIPKHTILARKPIEKSLGVDEGSEYIANKYLLCIQFLIFIWSVAFDK